MTIRPHLRYLSYVLRHKWFVLLAGLKTGAPLWRLLVHDWSKFTPPEWAPYVYSFYIDRKAPGVKERFDAAWNHHQKSNPHHWNYWSLVEDGGTVRALPIPDHFVREMVADWAGAGRAISGKWEVWSWYEANKGKMLLAPSTRELVDGLLEDIHGNL